jgi:phosphohistidine swiveling domain-containing protein
MSLFVNAPSRPGGKAKTLMALRAAGFRVPDFVVSPADLASAVRRLGFPLAVRSSASVEDGHELSFAGQFRSYLNLHSLAEVEHAIGQCRASVSAPIVAEYCRKHGLDPDRLQMEVIVQRMVEPELAGVAFTVNPSTGAEEVVIEACAGLADDLLAGRVPPLPHSNPLLQRYAPTIEAVARRTQRHFGMPQDIEFAIAQGELYVLQARPITRIGFGADIGQWTNADFRDGGVSSGVCSPLMWSLYDFVWEDALKGFLRRLRLLHGDFQAGRLFFGRPYWNLGAVKQCLTRLPGYVERDFDADLNVQTVYEGVGHATPVTLWGILRALPTALAIPPFYREQEADARRLLEGDFAAIERKYEEPTGESAVFRELIERDFYKIESLYFRTIFEVALAKFEFKRAFPDADYAALVAGLPELRHMAPLRALRELAVSGRQDVTPLLRQFRHHYRQGLDVIAPRWDEERPYVEALLRDLPSSAGTDPRPAYEQARADALRKLPFWKRRAFRRKLDRLRTFVWLREEMRDLSSRMYYLIRRHALAIARRRGIGEDIFFMTFREIFSDDRSSIERNREAYDSYRHFAAPNEIGARFSCGQPAVMGGLQGIGASPGTARGATWLASSVEEALAAERGTILVCPFIDPGWTPVLDRFAGVVAETGGLLSHAAVICREFGIPAVLGVPGALQRIRHGSTVIVHGATGHVQVLDQDSDAHQLMPARASACVQ